MFRYHLQQDKNGTMVRLNRFTGEVATLEGNQLVVAEKPRETVKFPPTKPRGWNPTTIEDLGNLQVKVTTMWRDDSMLYRVEISPFSTPVRKAMENPFVGAKWILLFEDENGFEIATTEVEVAGVTRLVDGRGGFTGVEQKGSTPVAFDAYSKIQFIDVKWSGFPARSATDCVLVRDWCRCRLSSTALRT